jgi:dCMP deaminase
MNNYKWDITFLKIAKIISLHSTCIRKKVGCIITIDNRIISIGYNGVPPGKPHCEDIFKNKLDDKNFYKEHGEFSKEYELHAEQNSISFAAKKGLSIDKGNLYVTLSPCISCAKMILTSGIKKVIYLEEYDRDKEGLNLLKRNIDCYQISRWS